MSEATAMALQAVPARRGATWARRGFQVFAKQPLVIGGMFTVFFFGGFVLSLVPLFGPVLVSALLPLVSLGFMAASRAVGEGRLPSPQAFVKPLRGQKAMVRALVQLGIAYAVCSLLIAWLTAVVDGGALAALVQALMDPKTPPELLQQRQDDPRLEAGLLLRLVLSTALSIPFWHAPALVYWGGQGSAQAVFSSTLGCWRNKGAFMVFGAVWVGLLMALGLLASLTLAMLGLGEYAALAGVPSSFFLLTALYASLYASFADCFRATSGGPL